MKILSKIVLALISFGLVFIYGCSSTSKGVFKDLIPIIPTKAAVFQQGTVKSNSSASIGLSGGTLNGTDELAGVKVYVPAGALTEGGATFTLSLNTGTISLNSGTYDKALLLSSSGQKSFEKPIEITVPISNTDDIPVVYSIDENNNLNLCDVVRIDTVGKTFTFTSFHTSLFAIVYANSSSSSASVSKMASSPAVTSATTTYDPTNDGFQIVNFGSTFNRGGECFGMTSWSLWWFKNKKPSMGVFFPKYMNVIDTDSDGKNITGQDVIATRAFISIAQKWTTYYANIVTVQQGLSAKSQLNTIINAIANTQKPVLIYLYNVNGQTAHSVLAYKASSSGLSIYDPNLPNTSNTIGFQSNQWQSYSGYSGIVYSGDGTLQVAESFENILKDAQENFHRDGDPVVTIDSHQNNQTVSQHTVTLEGKIDSGQVEINKLLVYVGSVRYFANLGEDGEFSIPVSLENGKNYIRFQTYGKKSDGTFIEVPNTYQNRDFVLNCETPKSKILVTLTWNTNNTDVDLYVIDPTNDYSCYYHKETADGGILDYDITTGYGPEHWTLMNTNTIRYNQPYRIRAHYYGDHGNGGTSYTVTVKTDEGTSKEKTITKTGYLGASSSSNDDPTDTGADWADIADVTLTNGNQINIQSIKKITPVYPPVNYRKSLK